MKIAFSTVGCPEWSWNDIYVMAKDLRYNGIELRGLENEMNLTKARPFTDAVLEKTLQSLKQKNLSISCLASSCDLGKAGDDSEVLKEGFAYIALAAKLDCPYVRILGDPNPDPRGEINDNLVIARLKQLIPAAEKAGVCLLVETSGVYADSARLKALIETVDSACVRVLWDIHHPFRFFHEAPAETLANIGKYTKYVHIKDSVISEDGSVQYKILGDGDVPVVEILDLLKISGYDDFVSLEWVKRWNKNLEDAAIVFPAFANFMSDYLIGEVHKLYDNKAGTGKFPWPKEHLIDCTFPDVLDRICDEFPEQYAFRYTELDYTRTYPQFREDVYTFARALISMGVKKGDHVAIWATNVPAWYITFWATSVIGAVLVTVNTAYKVHEAEYLLRQSDTHTLVMIDKCKDSNYIEIINTLCPELKTSAPGALNSKKLPRLKNIVTVDSKQPGCYSWDEAVALSEKTPLDEVLARRAQINKHDVCNMQYTS
ncbi:MAG: AMP-binding protein, partial [Clostridia bacterium]|nr:AMP-binding protein [Clostridia bacterium]